MFPHPFIAHFTHIRTHLQGQLKTIWPPAYHHTTSWQQPAGWWYRVQEVHTLPRGEASLGNRKPARGKIPIFPGRGGEEELWIGRSWKVLHQSKIYGLPFLEKKTKPYRREGLDGMHCSVSSFSNMNSDDSEKQWSILWSEGNLGLILFNMNMDFWN